MASQIGGPPSAAGAAGRREGVRGAEARSSERDATRSSDGRGAVLLAIEKALLLRLLAVLNGGDAVRDMVWCAELWRLKVCRVLVMFGTTFGLCMWSGFPACAVLRSVWRLFWNQMVTDFISLWCSCEIDGARCVEGYLHSACVGDSLAILARWMRVLVEEVLEHCELCVCEALARATRAADGGDGAGAHGRVVLGGDAGGRGGARQGHWGLDVDGGGVHWECL